MSATLEMVLMETIFMMVATVPLGGVLAVVEEKMAGVGMGGYGDRGEGKDVQDAAAHEDDQVALIFAPNIELLDDEDRYDSAKNVHGSVVGYKRSVSSCIL